MLVKDQVKAICKTLHQDMRSNKRALYSYIFETSKNEGKGRKKRKRKWKGKGREEQGDREERKGGKEGGKKDAAKFGGQRIGHNLAL